MLFSQCFSDADMSSAILIPEEGAVKAAVFSFRLVQKRLFFSVRRLVQKDTSPESSSKAFILAAF
jgi:hypothetical protein